MRRCRNLHARNERLMLEEWSIEQILNASIRYRRNSPDPEGQDRLRDFVEKMFYHRSPALLPMIDAAMELERDSALGNADGQ